MKRRYFICKEQEGAGEEKINSYPDENQGRGLWKVEDLWAFVSGCFCRGGQRPSPTRGTCPD